MIKLWAEELSLHLVTNKIITIDKRKYYIYGIELLLNDLFIFLTIAAIAMMTKTVLISILFAGCFCVLRAFAGGYHCKSYRCCFQITLFNYSLLLLLHFILTDWKLIVGVIIIILSIPVIWLFSPVESVNNPLEEKERIKYKSISRVLTVILFILFTISAAFRKNEIAFVIAWSVFATAFLMLLPIINEKRRRMANDETRT